MKIGILGGTFDPIHKGHLAAAQVALDCARLDLVLFIPSARPPHREGAAATPEQRLDMARLAVAGNDRFGVSDVEVRRGGPSYTVDTLTELTRSRPDDELYLILGWDAARLFATWHRPADILRLARVVVVGRPGTPTPRTDELNAAGLEPARVVLCTAPTPDISGSALRRAIARGELPADRIPAAVRRYIADHGLYMDNRRVGC